MWDFPLFLTYLAAGRPFTLHNTGLQAYWPERDNVDYVLHFLTFSAENNVDYLLHFFTYNGRGFRDYFPDRLIA